MFYFISVDYELNKGSDIEIGLRYVISIYISILATGSHGDSTSDKFKLINVSRLVFVCLLLVVYKVDFFSPLFFHSNHHKLDTTRMSLLPSTNICASHMIRQLILPHRNKQFQYPFLGVFVYPYFKKFMRHTFLFAIWLCTSMSSVVRFSTSWYISFKSCGRFLTFSIYSGVMTHRQRQALPPSVPKVCPFSFVCQR